MSGNSPSIYLLTGDDEFAIRSFLEERLKPKMGDSANATMDITTLDGTIQNLDAIHTETQTMPFLSKRRMVILHNPLALTRGKANQEKFKNLLDCVPASTALVLIEDRILDRDHWLMNWVQDNNNICYTGSQIVYFLEYLFTIIFSLQYSLNIFVPGSIISISR